MVLMIVNLLIPKSIPPLEGVPAAHHADWTAHIAAGENSDAAVVSVVVLPVLTILT